MTQEYTFSKRGKLVLSLVAGAVTTVLGIGVFTITNPNSSGAVASSASAAKVIPFERGQPSPATPVGQIPPGFKDGDGALITGTAANKAKTAAVAVYPGGAVDRVSVLSDGEYNVHIIGVNWPHHVFVNQDFKVVGAE